MSWYFTNCLTVVSLDVTQLGRLVVLVSRLVLCLAECFNGVSRFGK